MTLFAGQAQPGKLDPDAAGNLDAQINRVFAHFASCLTRQSLQRFVR